MLRNKELHTGVCSPNVRPSAFRHCHWAQGRTRLSFFPPPEFNPTALENTICGKIEPIFFLLRINTNLGGPLTDRRVKHISRGERLYARLHRACRPPASSVHRFHDRNINFIKKKKKTCALDQIVAFSFYIFIRLKRKACFFGVKWHLRLLRSDRREKWGESFKKKSQIHNESAFVEVFFCRVMKIPIACIQKGSRILFCVTCLVETQWLGEAHDCEWEKNVTGDEYKRLCVHN